MGCRSRPLSKHPSSQPTTEGSLMSRILIGVAVGFAFAVALVALPASAVLRPGSRSSETAASPVATSYHARFIVTAAGPGGGCTPARPNLPNGVRFQIESILVSLFGASPSQAPRFALHLTKKVSATSDVELQMGISMSTTNAFDYASAVFRPGPLVVRPSSLEEAAVGDIYDVRFCATKGSAPSGVSARVIVVGSATRLDPRSLASPPTRAPAIGRG